MATVALWALNRSLASNISGHWGQTDLEFSPQEILNRSNPEAGGPVGIQPRHVLAVVGHARGAAVEREKRDGSDIAKSGDFSAYPYCQ